MSIALIVEMLCISSMTKKIFSHKIWSYLRNYLCNWY